MLERKTKRKRKEKKKIRQQRKRNSYFTLFNMVGDSFM